MRCDTRSPIPTALLLACGLSLVLAVGCPSSHRRTPLTLIEQQQVKREVLMSYGNELGGQERTIIMNANFSYEQDAYDMADQLIEESRKAHNIQEVYRQIPGGTARASQQDARIYRRVGD